MKPLVSAELLQKSKEAQLANLLKKQASGKTLTAREEAAIAEGAGEKAGYATTWDRLAEALGITRRGLLLVRTRHAQAEDLPKPKPDGRHSIDAWRSFFATHGIEGRQMDQDSSGGDSTSPAAWKARQIEQQVIKLQLANELTKRQQIALTELQAKLPPFLMAIRTAMDQCIPELATSLEGIDDYSEREEIIQEQFNKVFTMLTACPWLDEKPLEMEDAK
jgi:hypothetical protein